MSATLELAGRHPNLFDRARSPAASEPDALAPLAVQSALIRAGRDKQIFGQGDPARYCYFVLSGCVRSVFLIEDGRRQVSEFLLPGDLFGWEAADEYDFSAEAVTPVFLRRYRRSSLEALADSDRNLARTLRNLSARQLRVARERMVLLGRKTASERIASFLLEMARRLHATSQIRLPMNRGDIADHLGLTVETVCRGLTQLRREGTIAVERGNVAICDPDALGAAERATLH